MATPENRQRLHLQGFFSSPEEKETFLKRFEAARLLLAPGVNKRNATISVLNALLDRVLTQTDTGKTLGFPALVFVRWSQVGGREISQVDLLLTKFSVEMVDLNGWFNCYQPGIIELKPGWESESFSCGRAFKHQGAEHPVILGRKWCWTLQVS